MEIYKGVSVMYFLPEDWICHCPFTLRADEGERAPMGHPGMSTHLHGQVGNHTLDKADFAHGPFGNWWELK